MKKITIGIIAHVDSGKTTLSEALLYLSGTIRSFGRVDKGASFLDNDEIERSRGITIFSKQARFEYRNTSFVLIDTPGHADFSAETERTLGILDYAVLLISASDGIKGQTKILWKLLSEYRIPVFLFFNKMDREDSDKDRLLSDAKELTGDSAVDFTELTDPSSEESSDIFEQIALCSESAMEEFLNTGMVPLQTMQTLIRDRKLFPCLFGSALRMDGVDKLLAILDLYTLPVQYPEAFSARVYKVARDRDGVRLTFAKITGGSLRNKTLIPDGDKESKINQIRLYSGDKYTLKETAESGDICAFTGLKNSFAGAEYIEEAGSISLSEASSPLLSPVLSYRVLPENEIDPVKALPVFKTLEEESPELSVSWDEDKQDIYISVMGKVQLEILKTILEERFGLTVSFDSGNVVYKETILEPVIGVSHFEPLRHYAEVHLLLEPLPRGKGLLFASSLSSDKLSKNWQRLILTHLSERQHRGVLTGSPITDMKITLIAGRAHLKHTEGGDFRQATYRAVRQGLMMAESILLEPFYRFSLEVPTESIGRALTDLDRIRAEFSAPEANIEKGLSVISGRGPVSALKDYPAEVASYTKGLGNISFIPDGYGDCHNAEEVILQKGYDPEADLKNTADSVFCQNGAGHIVPCYEVYEHMHLPMDGSGSDSNVYEPFARASQADARTVSKTALGTEEVNAIIRSVSGSNTKTRQQGRKWKKKFGTDADSAPLTDAGGKSIRISGLQKQSKKVISAFPLEEADIVLVDGYNVIFAWEELSSLASKNIDSARDALTEILSKFSAMIRGDVIVVFDAYKVKGRPGEMTELSDIKIVYTAEEQTADQYIERFVTMAGNNYKSGTDGVSFPPSFRDSLKKKTGAVKIAVVTSDAVEQVVTMGQGCKLLSSRDFKTQIHDLTRRWNEKYGIR